VSPVSGADPTFRNTPSRRVPPVERIVVVPAEARPLQSSNDELARASENPSEGPSQAFDYWQLGPGPRVSAATLDALRQVIPSSLVLVTVEYIVLSIAICAVVVEGYPGATVVQFVFALSMTVIAVMGSVGLYKIDALLHFHVTLLRLATALLLAVPIVLALHTAFPTFSDPIDGLARMIECVAEPGIIFYSTLVQPADFDNQGMAWWYVGPRNGHVSMFTKQALAAAWAHHGYKNHSLNDNMHVAYRTLPDGWQLN